MVILEKKKRIEKLQDKVCKFPGCNKKFRGTGKSLYCKIHREKKYRKEIDKAKNDLNNALNDINNPNFTLNHDYTTSTTIVRKCDCCDNTYEIMIFPKTFIYSRYCSDHRNEYKRKLYIISIGKLSLDDIKVKANINVKEYTIEEK